MLESTAPVPCMLGEGVAMMGWELAATCVLESTDSAGVGVTSACIDELVASDMNAVVAICCVVQVHFATRSKQKSGQI